jgi:hypothetical protein
MPFTPSGLSAADHGINGDVSFSLYMEILPASSRIWQGVLPEFYERTAFSYSRLPDEGQARLPGSSRRQNFRTI